jgi:hypothetical protein
MSDSTCAATPRCPDTRGKSEGNPEVAGIVLVLFLIGWAVLRHAGRKARASWRVGANHPLLLEARRKANASLASLRQLHAGNAGRSQVRWAPAPSYTIADWVWSDLDELGADSCVVAVPALPGVDAAQAPQQHSVNLQDLVDWQVQLPDGSIRGGFTTQAEIRLAKQLGAPLAESMRHADGKFLDS